MLLVKMTMIYEKGEMIMRLFDYSKLRDKKYDSTIINLLTSIHEAKGRQEQYLSQKPQELNRLVDIAKIQSVESSNAIEGIRTTSTRIKQLVNQKTTPKNRDEEEISGYRDALDIIHESYDCIPLKPAYILYLHKVLFGHVHNAGHAGKYKNVQNYIQGMDENGESFVVFKPLEPYETPDAIESLCDAYNKAIEEKTIDPLITIATFVHDFLCIHPFVDGNGRMSRLLTTLLLYRNGYYVGKYISLEAKINAIKDHYYDALAESQENWHKGGDDATPFVKFILSVIDMSYADFEKRLELVSNKMSAAQIVEKALERKIGRIKKADIVELCPSLSISSVEKAISSLVDCGKLTKQGSGKNTFYTKND